MTTQTHNVIIIGSGPAGLTAAIYAARAALSPLVIEGTKPGGQLMNTTAVENWPGEQSILGPKLMMNMRAQAEYLGVQFITGEIASIETNTTPFTMTTKSGKTFKTKTIIVATGASANTLKCPGEEEYWGKGVTVCAVCDGAFYPNKKVIIVGGGDTAMEDASFMSKYTKDITIVHVLDKLTASAAMQKRVLDANHISVIYSSTVTAIKGDGSRVTHVEITNQQTKVTQTLEADVIFLAIGQKPNTQFLKDKVELHPQGYIVLSGQGTATSKEGIFAAGDVADYRYKQAITSAASGCMAALDMQRYLEKIS